MEWCACFASWCADQCGYLESGIIPKFSLCSDGVNWFKGKGQWQDKNYEPQAGDLIFFDWGSDGSIDHVGIVEKCENGTVYTVEGNSGDACKQQSYPVGSNSIYGYDARTISWAGQKENQRSILWLLFCLTYSLRCPSYDVSSASSKKHPIDCVRLFFLPKFMRYNVVVNIYGCRLVIVLIDGYNIMVCWAVRYI